MNDKLYFHGAKTGYKIDAIRRCSKASFCVIDQDQIVQEEYTTYFRSVIAFGKIRILEEEKEVRDAAEGSDPRLVFEKIKETSYSCDVS